MCPYVWYQLTTVGKFLSVTGVSRASYTSCRSGICRPLTIYLDHELGIEDLPNVWYQRSAGESAREPPVYSVHLYTAI